MSALVIVCALLISAKSDLPSAFQQSFAAALAQPTATAVIPGMPPCDCAFACDFPLATSTPPAPTPTTVVQASNNGRVVALDPGHGGKETGAVSAGGLAEKDVNLRIAL